jgi:hypothetical protein
VALNRGRVALQQRCLDGEGRAMRSLTGGGSGSTNPGSGGRRGVRVDEELALGPVPCELDSDQAVLR